MKRREFVEKLGIGSAALAAAGAVGSIAASGSMALIASASRSVPSSGWKKTSVGSY